MPTELRIFIRQYLAVVAAALALVLLTAFVSIPFTMGGHPGESRVATEAARHMS